MNAETYLDTVRTLLPEIAARAADCEAQRRLPDETFKAFQETGLMRAVQPARWGGHELPPPVLYEALTEVAAACPSSAWFLGVVGIHNWQLGLFPEEAQADVWGEDTSVQLSSSYAPTGRVETAPGGFRLSGRWSFSSGCDHCQWVLLGGIAPGEGPAPDMRTFLVPRSDYAIDDNWHVAGLAGTGSKDIVIEDAFVPEHRTHRFIDAYNFASPGQALNDGPVYRLPFGCVFAFCVAVPAIGAAQGALDAYRSEMREKVAVYDGGKVADDPLAQRRIAEATVEIDAGRAELREVWGALWALAEAGEPIPLDLRARARWTSANLVQRGMKAVDLLFDASGGRAIYLHNPIQRFFRDVHAMRAHAINNPDKASRIFGHTELHPGTPPPEFFL